MFIAAGKPAIKAAPHPPVRTVEVEGPIRVVEVAGVLEGGPCGFKSSCALPPLDNGLCCPGVQGHTSIGWIQKLCRVVSNICFDGKGDDFLALCLLIAIRMEKIMFSYVLCISLLKVKVVRFLFSLCSLITNVI